MPAVLIRRRPRTAGEVRARRGRDIAATAAATVLGTLLLTASSCQGGPTVAKACDLTFADLTINAGQVVATVHPSCDPPPDTHILKVVIELQVADTWTEWGRALIVDAIPDAAGFDATARAECREGVYRVHARVDGAGPDGIPFVFDDTGPATPIALVQCAG